MARRFGRTMRYDSPGGPGDRAGSIVVTAPAPARRRTLSLWIAAVLTLLVALAAGAYVATKPAEPHAPPPALSSAGRPVPNEAYQWRHVAIGGGGFITGLSMDPAGKTFVVRTDVYGGYIWDQATNRWQQLVTQASMPGQDRVQNGAPDGVYEIAVAPSRADRIYMAIKGFVYRSDDRGKSWTLPTAGNPFPFTWDANSEFRLSGPFMAVSPTDPDLVLLGTPGNGLWRSADGGAHWARVASVPGVIDQRPDQGVQAPGVMIWFEKAAGGRATGRIWALSAGHGMYVSKDGGVSFSSLPSGSAQPLVLRRGTFDRNGVFFGVDGGTQTIWNYKDGNWHDLTQASGVRGRVFAAVAANPRADEVIAFDQGGYGYQSTDGGKSWHHVSHESKAGAGDPPWLRLSNGNFFATGDVAFDPVVPNKIWVAAGMGVFHADMPPSQLNASWESQTRGIEELVANDVIQPPHYSPVFGGWDFGIHVKDDLNAYSTTFGPGERGLIAAQQLDWTPAAPGFVVTNASDTRIGCCAEDGNAVMAGYSEDGGHHWSKFATLPTPDGTKPDDPWRMAFGSIAVSSGDPNNIVWVPAFNKTPFFTTDRGRSWHAIILPGAIGPKPGSFEQLYYQRKTLAADKTLPGVFYMVHSGEAPNQALAGLWRSPDGGAHWERVFSGEIAPASNFAAKLRSVPGHGGHLFFTSAFAYNDDTRLRRSTDGGANWQIVPDVTRVDDIAFGKAARGASYPTIFISGRVNGAYGIWRSIDNAKSWQRLTDFPVGTLDQVTVVGADPDVFGRVYIGYKGSGWIWGEPAPCKPQPYRSLSAQSCAQVE